MKKGFTLIELMVVVAIIGILGAALTPAVGGLIQRAREARAESDVGTIVTAMYALFNDTGRTPGNADTNGTGLNAPAYGIIRANPTYNNWGGPYLDKAVELDPWGRQYFYDGAPGEWTGAPGQASFMCPGFNGVLQSWNRQDLTLQGDDIGRYLHI